MLLASQGIRKDVSETDFSQLNFEQALIALEEVVQQLESGSVPLD
ncbi:MAG: exodeoxyribonuclease VII small subunit, partial [Altererythrobacter sp.]|nr:exodeoxyribonuclease VII small subunit [Altererythrobacter sp.]